MQGAAKRVQQKRRPGGGLVWILLGLVALGVPALIGARLLGGEADLLGLTELGMLWPVALILLGAWLLVQRANHPLPH
jgi:hypothetical protein